MKNFSNQALSYLFACGAIFFWSTVATAFKLSLEYLDPVQLVFFASIFSTITLFIIVLVQRKLPLIRELDRADVFRYFLLALLNPFLYYIVLLNAYDLLSAQEAMAINYSWVIMMAILSFPILKQRANIGTLIAILISYFGVVIIATKGDPIAFEFTSSIGVIYALITTVIWALFWLLNTKQSNDSVVSLFVIFCFSIIFVSFAMIISPSLRPITLYGLAASAYIGLFEMGVTFVMWQYALSLSSNINKITSLAFVTPFLSLLIIYMVIDEQILASSIVGISLIILGLLVQRYFSKNQES